MLDQLQKKLQQVQPLPRQTQTRPQNPQGQRVRDVAQSIKERGRQR